MPITIEIRGSTLILPDGAEIAPCWQDRTQGLLTNAASLALMPYINAEERDLRAAEQQSEAATPSDLYIYTIDGETAWTGKVVHRDELDVLRIGAGLPTGQVVFHTRRDLDTLLGLTGDADADLQAMAEHELHHRQWLNRHDEQDMASLQAQLASGRYLIVGCEPTTRADVEVAIAAYQARIAARVLDLDAIIAELRQ